jgi:D-glycerate 3-kinase
MALKFIIENHWGYHVLSISLDDFYKTYSDRQKLQTLEPRLIWRGPPGTHDVDLAMDILSKIKAGNQDIINVPTFDKSLYNGMGDRGKFKPVSKIDLVLFEGWFVGVQPIDEHLFNQPIEPIRTLEDIQWAKDCNRWLKDYVPLWEKLDGLIILYPLDYRWSKEWRWEAEKRMIQEGKGGMTKMEVDSFVDYFWRSLHPQLFIPELLKTKTENHIVLNIDRDRLIAK